MLFLYGVIGYCQYPTLPTAPTHTDIFDNQNQTTNVINTGNDILCGQYTDDRMHVEVCDGDRPSFIWWDNYWYSNTAWTIPIDQVGNLNPDIVDPDVVLFRTYSNNLSGYTYQAMIVFEVNGGIYYIIKEFDGSGNTWSQTAGPYFIGDGVNPNIDATTPQGLNTSENKFVVVWEDGGYIRTYLDDFVDGAPVSGTMPIYYIYDSGMNIYYGAARTPDVTISYTTDGSTYDFMVTYTFLIDLDLVFFQEKFNNLINNSFNPTTAFGNITSYNSGDVIGRPRIASPDVDDGGLLYYPGDFEIVIDINDQIQNDVIYGYNMFQGSLNPYNYEWINSDNFGEANPVVCYSGDNSNISQSSENIIISWQLEYYSQFNNKMNDIIQITVQNDGQFNGPYRRVNIADTNDQEIPSVSGSWQSGMVFYTFMDFFDNQIKGKESGYSWSPLKNKIDNDGLLYPNPALDNINIPVENEGNATIFDVRGVKVANYQLSKGLNSLNLNLSPGIYYIEIKPGKSNEARKLIIF